MILIIIVIPHDIKAENSEDILLLPPPPLPTFEVSELFGHVASLPASPAEGIEQMTDDWQMRSIEHHEGLDPRCFRELRRYGGPRHRHGGKSSHRHYQRRQMR